MLETIRNVVWSMPMLVFLIVFGSYVMIRLSFLPILKADWVLGTVFQSLFQKKKRQEALQCISVALGGTMGIGNIIGVSSCVLIFGPGTIFWMWMSALIGMALKYLEIVLAMIFRVQKETISGGPMWNMERGLQMKWMGKGYAILCILTSFGIGNLVPMNALTTLFANRVSVSQEVVIVFLVVFISLILFKNNHLIERILFYLVPSMTLLLMGASLIIICINAHQLYAVIGSIFNDVFSFSSLIGGGWFIQMQAGMTRGIYSNEAGLGSSSIAHVKNTHLTSVEQGAWGIVEVGLDTIVSCTLTAFVVLLMKNQVIYTDVYQAMHVAFIAVFGTFGDFTYLVSMVLFAVSSMLAWCYYAKECANYLALPSFLYPTVFILILLFGVNIQTSEIWQISDICNGLMIIINGASLVALQKFVYISTKKYFISKKDNVKITLGD
ncbi:MAG: amino acid carrier protein [Erysipelotrichaceae bacterium]|nr:amino acid carrier protein [Erysipelotrichaceae bacterium]